MNVLVSLLLSAPEMAVLRAMAKNVVSNFVIFLTAISRGLRFVNAKTSLIADNAFYRGVGRGCGVGRGLGVALGVALGVGLTVAVGVALGVGLGVGP